MAVLMPPGRQQYFDSAGDPLAGGKLYTYNAFTSTPRTTYADFGQITPNSNPVILDGRGEATVFWDGNYKITLTDASDVTIWTVDGAQGFDDADITSIATGIAVALVDDLRDDLADTFSASNGAGLSGFDANRAYVANTIGWAVKQTGISAAWFSGYDATGTTDSATAINAAIAFAVASSIKRIYLPGTPRSNSSISVSGGLTIYSDNMASTGIGFYGSEGFVATGDMVSFENMFVRSYTGAGVVDPRANVGINYTGTSGTRRYFGRLSNVYLRGWSRCVDLQYTWDTELHGVVTVNCTKGLRLFGQSVNNSVHGGNLTTIGGAGTVTVDLVPDGANVGEGLSFHGTLIGSAERGIVADGFLVCALQGCIVDDLTGVAITLDNSAGFSMSGGYLYSAAGCVQINARGSLTEISTTFQGVDIRSGAGAAINVDANNRNVKVSGGQIRYATSAVVSAATAQAVALVGVHGVQTGAGNQISLRGSGNDVLGCTGDMVADSATYATLRYAATSSWSPGSIANNVSVTSPAITVTGASIGDEVDLRAPTSEAGFICDAFVDSANNVRIIAYNVSGGAATPPGGTWSVRVRKT